MYFLTADGDIYYYQEATQKMQKLASLATVAGATSPTGNFLLKDKWVILTTTGVYTYKFATGEMAADPRLNIKKGELIRDNRGDYWIYNHTGRLTYVLAETGESKDFQLIPQDKIVISTLNVIISSMIPGELFGFRPMEMGFSLIIPPKINWSILWRTLMTRVISVQISCNM